MSINLNSKDLKLTLEIAGEIYKHCRFDWNGLISQVHFRGVPLLSEEKPEGERNPARFGRGLHNEFGIRKVIGYDEIPVGEWFPKIGTGWLKKDHKPYFFYDDYELEPFRFCVESDSRAAVFTCTSGERNGYAFEYKKTIELDDNHFRIYYLLCNRGEKALCTDEYVHNFLGFNNKNLGPAYRLTFPFALKPDNFFESNNPGGLLQFTAESLFPCREPADQYWLTSLSCGEEIPARWTLSHSEERIKLMEEGDFKTELINLWGFRHVISPELFFSFKLLPGAEVSWQRVYTVSQF